MVARYIRVKLLLGIFFTILAKAGTMVIGRKLDVSDRLPGSWNDWIIKRFQEEENSRVVRQELTSSRRIMTGGVQSELKNPDADTVRACGKVFRGKENE